MISPAPAVLPALGALLATLLMTAPSVAQGQSGEAASAYSSAKACKTVERFKVGGVDYASVRVCKGIGGYLAVISEDDLRETVSFGRDIRKAIGEPAASQGFGPFNSAHATIEWRGLTGGKPFAAIQRWTIADNENADPKTGRPASAPLLIVTRLEPSCHVAYVDARANADPNALARQAADTLARDFTCGKDKARVFGQTGRGAELALSTRHDP